MNVENREQTPDAARRERDLIDAARRQAAGGDTAPFVSSNAQDTDAAKTEAHPRRAVLPDRIGRYAIQDVLGTGGFGVVYLARDDQLDRQVAVKVPRRERIAEPADVEAYLAEARVVASLDHPHIVPVHDVGRTEDGRCFVVSKFIEGHDLRRLIEDHRPAFHESAQLVATIAEALHYAHLRKITHRDIKPANILVDEAGTPYVADFGLALKDEDFGHGSGVAGTPSYMSPEQARGEGHLVDGRSDIFSLGVMLYELLTGIQPFRGSGWQEVTDFIAKIDARPPRMIDDTIPKELEGICLKALSKQPTDRYTTAKDMAEDLRDFLASASRATPSTARVGPTAQNVKTLAETKPARKPRRLFVLAGMTLATVVLLLVVWNWRIGRQPFEPPTETGSIVSPPARVQAAAIGYFDILIGNESDAARTGGYLDEPGILPLRPGDDYSIQAELSHPAYAYVVLIDTEGQAFPVYPWEKPGDWASPRPTPEQPRCAFRMPPELDRGYRIPQARPGIVTVALMVRNTPLPKEVDLNEAFAGLPPSKGLLRPREAVWFENGQRVRNHRGGIGFFEEVGREDPVLAVQERLRMLRSDRHLFAHTLAVSFGNRGE